LLILGSTKTYALAQGSDWNKAVNVISNYPYSLSNFALQSYDTVKSTISSENRYMEVDVSWLYSDMSSAILESYMPNVVCMHTTAANTSEAFEGFYIEHIIDIDEDGNIQVDGGTLNSSYQNYAKYLAWVAYQLQNDSRCLYFESLGQGRGGAYYGGSAFREAFWNSGIGNLIGWTESSSDNTMNSSLNDLKYNSSNIESYEGYVGRLVFFKSLGGGQEQVAVFAKESENAKVSKYISNVSPSVSSDENLSERQYLTENLKMESPVYVGSNTEVTYTIKVTGPSTKKYTVKDEWENGYFSYVSSSLSGSVSGNSVTWNNVPGGTQITITLKTSSNISSSNTSKYKNSVELVGKENVKSTDYVQYLKEECKVDKYITSISGSETGVSIGNRSNLTDNEKMSSAPQVSGSSIYITYNIVIKNTGVATLTGTYSDSWASGMSLSSGTTSEIITLASGEEKVYTVTLKLSTTTTLQYYANTAKFSFGSNTVVSSSDYVQGYTEPQVNGTIKKYIVSPSSGFNRSSYSESAKRNSPVEVSRGTTVTYEVWFKNTSNRSLKYVTFTDTPGAGLSYQGCSGGITTSNGTNFTYTFCSHTDSWYQDEKNVSDYILNNIINDSDDLDPGKEAVLGRITYTVTTSDLQLTSIENRITVNTLGYLVQVYNYSSHRNDHCDCVPYWYSCDGCIPVYKNCVHTYTVKGVVKSYSHKKVAYYYCPGKIHLAYKACTGDGDCTCSKTCRTCYDRIYKYLEYRTQSVSDSSSDYVRLLDPTISGYVWFDLNSNGYKDGGEGATAVANGITYQASSVKVELVNASTGSVIATTYPDSSGKYSFGRVRKGTDLVGSNGSSNGYTNVATNQSFYYSSNSYMSYYIVFDYFGERFIATTYNAENEWRW
jgi:uncharacterized repeat protein (TIGR01451 family)